MNSLEREQAEEALRRSEERYRGLLTVASDAVREAEDAARRSKADAERQRRSYEGILSNTPDLAYVWDLDHRFIYVNEGLLRMWGKTWDEAIGRNCLELGYEPWHAAMHDREIELVKATKQPVRGEVPFTGTFGRRIYDYILVPVLDADGEVEAVAGTTRDVTERKEAEETLRRQSEQVASLLDAAPLGVYLLDADLRVREVNPVALPVFGEIPGGVIGRDFDEIMHILWDAAYADEVVAIFRRVLQTGEPFVASEAARRRVDRQVIEYYEWRVDRVTHPDGRHGVVCYFRDISQQVMARLRIAESEERFRTLVSIITDVPWSSDAEGSFVAPQPLWAAYTGQGWEEHRGHGWMRVVHPDDRDRIAARWLESQRTGSLYETRARVWHAASRQHRQMAIRATPLHNADGSLREWVGACTDIHERELAEVALRSAERMEAIGRLAGGVAHEANNQMTVVLGCTEFALRRDDLPPEIRDELLSIRRAGERTAAITSQLLAFGRRQLLRSEPLDLNAILEAFAPILQRTLGPGSELVLQLHPGLGTVLADRGQIEQVLVNLTFNARDAMPNGGRLILETGAVELLEPLIGRGRDEPLPPGGYGLLIARDSGSGMRPDTLARIFEPFFTTKLPGQGTGLGLSTVYGIVRQLGGHIEVESAPGEGTMFRIYVPLAPMAALTAQENRSTGDRPIAGTVLVVEDEPAVRSLAVRALESEGFAVLEAEHGQAALQVLERHPGEVRAVVSDVAMPVMDGRELAERLAAERPGVPVLFMSGYTADELVRRGMLLNATAPLLPKPFDPAALAERVRAIIGAPAGVSS